MITGAQKAALLLKSLGPDITESVLGHLPPNLAQNLRAEITKLKDSPEVEEQIDEVLNEIELLLSRARIEAQTAPPPAASSTPAAPQPPASESEEKSAESTGKKKKKKQTTVTELDEEDDALAALRSLPVEQLARALKDENPRTAVLVLQQMDVEAAGELLKHLPANLRKALCPYLGKKFTVGKPLVERVARALFVKSQLVEPDVVEETDEARYRKVADMLRMIDKNDRMEMVAALEENDPEAAAAVKEFLYRFEDIQALDDRSIQKVLAEIDTKTLATALKEAGENIRDRVANNLSARAREALFEEIEFLGNVSKAQTEAAEKEIVAVIQRLDQAGEIVMQ
ncbi:MAG: flagellar motor switch protein FliG [Gemmatales bacterium]|nr:MAG: flagellar motor switch protein FliG [Gemmatales bacterium]